MLVPASSTDSHLLGQHTVRMSPISTAQLNPNHHTFCLAHSGDAILIPVLMNNTNPSTLRYSITPLGDAEDMSRQDKPVASYKTQYIDLSSRDLKAIEHARVQALELTRTETLAKRQNDEDDYDDEDEEGDGAKAALTHPSLQRSQGLTHIRVNKPGVIRLERVIHSSSIDARIAYPTSVVIAPCPRASFVDDNIVTRDETVRCAGDNPDLALKIDIYGVPPLSLRWYKDVNGKRESFMVEGIEAGHRGHGHSTGSANEELHAEEGNRGSRAERGVPQNLQVPLTVSVHALGTHAYVLESVVDGLGNEVLLNSAPAEGVVGALRKVAHPISHDGNSTAGAPANSKTTRSLRVLRRPSVTWAACGPGSPASLLIGSETALTVSTKDVDALDAPLEVTVQYVPSPESASKAGNLAANLGLGKKRKPWTLPFKSHPERRTMQVTASSPGEYVITSVKGQYCEGDVLSPETCKVVEMPHPIAEIEWKRIHEWCVSNVLSRSLHLTNVSRSARAILGFPSYSPSMAHRPSKFTIGRSRTKPLRASWLRTSMARGESSRSSLNRADTIRIAFSHFLTQTTKRLCSMDQALNKSYIPWRQWSLRIVVPEGGRKRSTAALETWLT
jgi:nucleoporin POM152